MTKHFLFINGSPSGSDGNTAVLMSYAADLLAKHGSVRWLNLSEGVSVTRAEQELRECSGILIGTGTYWDSWGSSLQKFLEDMTHTEGSDCWLGKPVGVVVSMHSVGGKGVLSRLQGVLNTFGAIIPPMSAMVYSAVAELALQGAESVVIKDLWRPSDLDIICHNLVESSNGSKQWRSWPVERDHFSGKWLKSVVEKVKRVWLRR